MKPGQQHIGDLLKRIQTVDVEALHRRIADALQRSAAGSVTRDGYPPNAGLRTGGAGGPRILVDDESIAATSVEAAALTEQARDPVRHHTLSAVAAVVDAVEALGRCESALTMVEKLGGFVPIESTLCQQCGDAGLNETATKWTDVGGVLRRPMRLCDNHVDYVKRFGELPSGEQTRHHARTAIWRVPAHAL